LVQKSVSLSRSIKTIDPSAEVFGPVEYGFSGYYDFQSAPDWNSVKAGKSYTWFLDYYLDQLKLASDTSGRRLLDVLDLHWYPKPRERRQQNNKRKCNLCCGQAGADTGTALAVGFALQGN